MSLLLLLVQSSVANGDGVALEQAEHDGIAQANRAITRYIDTQDGSEYLYTLFVPMDADMAFPCFDQPDLKGRFTLTTVTPTAWSVIANTAATR